MSIKDLLTKEGRRERSLQKNCAKAANKKIKPDDRRPALYSLLENGSDEAVTGLFKRFTFVYDTNIVMDEEEKQMVYDGLKEMGERVLPQLRQHLKRSPTLSWGLRLLTKITSPETVWQVVSEVLEDYEPGYERDPSRKLQLMTFLGEIDDDRAVDALIPYLEDDDETVRYTTAESLFQRGDERAREPLLALMTNDEEDSLRIKHRIADGFVDSGWTVKGFRGTVEKLLSADLPEFHLDGKGRVKRKKARKQG